MRHSLSTNIIPAILLAIAASVHAQCAPDFPVQVQTNLRVEYQSTDTNVNPAGTLLQQKDVVDTPTVQGPKDSTRTQTFMLFMIDQDVSTSSGQRSQFLQFFEPNLSGASEVLFADSSVPNATDASRVAYLPPTPPAGDGPHRYTLLLYPQSKGFKIPNSFASFFSASASASDDSDSARLGFDMARFAQAAGLGDPVSANWFRVQNGDVVASPIASTLTLHATSTSASASASTEHASSASANTQGAASTHNTAGTFTIVTPSASESASPSDSTNSAAASTQSTSTSTTTTINDTTSTTETTLSPVVTVVATSEIGSGSITSLSSSETTTTATVSAVSSASASASASLTPAGSSSASHISLPKCWTAYWTALGTCLLLGAMEIL